MLTFELQFSPHIKTVRYDKSFLTESILFFVKYTFLNLSTVFLFNNESNKKSPTYQKQE